MSIELFVVKNKGNEIVQRGFSKKAEAKAARNKLQSETESGVPDPKKAMHKNSWSFHVALGKDHRNYAG